MKDLQVISVVDDFLIDSVTQADDSPRTVLLYAAGGGLDEAQRVLVNDLGVDTFTSLSRYQISVVLPETVKDLPLNEMTFAVLGSYATGRRRVRLLHGFTRRPAAVSGVQKLVQHVVRTLLTTQGTNRFEVTRGGNLVSQLNGLDEGGGDLAIIMAQATQSTEQYIRAMQRGARSLPLDERLRSLRFGGLDYGSGEVTALVHLETFAGVQNSFPVVL
jgi:hypothetical protein